jgi:hypothetical protein
MTDKIEVTFFLDGKAYGSRFWTHVPRVGDEVMLNIPRSAPATQRDVQRKQMVCNVCRVVWGVELDTALRQAVNIVVERVTA